MALASSPSRTRAACANACVAPAGMPVGRRSPRGRRRWYPVWAPGREQATCDRLRAVLPEDLLTDAFVLRREQWRKRHGVWEKRVVPLWEGYLFVSTPDVAGLDKAMAKLSFPAQVAKGEGHYAPLEDAAQAWYERVCDASHVIRSSTGVIVGGELDIREGPLVGQEDRVAKIDRHKAVCWVSVGDSRDGFHERAPLVVPSKS